MFRPRHHCNKCFLLCLWNYNQERKFIYNVSSLFYRYALWFINFTKVNRINKSLRRGIVWNIKALESAYLIHVLITTISNRYNLNQNTSFIYQYYYYLKTYLHPPAYLNSCSKRNKLPQLVHWSDYSQLFITKKVLYIKKVYIYNKVTPIDAYILLGKHWSQQFLC